MRQKDFLRVASGSGAIKFLDIFLGFILGVVFARTFGVNDYGDYSFVMAVLMLVILVAQFGIPELAMREVSAALEMNDDKKASTLTIKSAFFMILSSLSIVIIGEVSLFCLSDSINPKIQNLLSIGLLLIPAYVALNLLTTIFRARRKVLLSQILMTLFVSFLVLGLVSIHFLFISADFTSEAAITSRILAVITSLTIAIAITLRLSKQVKFEDLKTNPNMGEMAKSSLPFLLIGGAAVLMSHTDLVMLGLYLGTDSVGIYKIAIQGAILILLPLHIANTVVVQEFARQHSTKDYAEMEMLAVMSSRVVFLVSAVIAIFLIMFGEYFISTIFGDEYISANKILTLLCFGRLISLIFGEPGFILNMTGNQSITLKLFSGAAVLNIMLNLFLIPIWGVSGAAYATTISLILWRLSACFFVQKRLGVSCHILGATPVMR